MVSRQHTGIDQHSQSRRGIKSRKGSSIETGSLEHFLVGTDPGFRDGPQARVGRLHPPQLHFLEQFNEGIGFRDGVDGLVKGLFAGVTHRGQFIEQAPGPRGSPQDPQAPDPLVLAQSELAPTPKGENCFCSFVALHDGQAGVVEPCTIASNRWLHSWQRYSKMGMKFSCVRTPL